MFFAEAQIRVHLYGQPTDMRKSYDGLQALARHAMSRNPLDGALYVFVNRRGSQIKCLYFDRSGFCIRGKRLETGRFISDWRNVRTREMDWTGLKLLLEGLEGKRVRKRFFSAIGSRRKPIKQALSRTPRDTMSDMQSAASSGSPSAPR